MGPWRPEAARDIGDEFTLLGPGAALAARARGAACREDGLPERCGEVGVEVDGNGFRGFGSTLSWASPGRVGEPGGRGLHDQEPLHAGCN